MRYFLIILCLFCTVAFADQKATQKDIPPAPGKVETSDKRADPANVKQEMSVNLPPNISMNLGGKLNITNQNKQSNAYEEPSKWTDPVALVTLGLLIVNILLWLTTKTAANAAMKSVKLARKEFNASHRPKFIVRRIAHLEKDGAVIGVQYAVYNVGDADGILIATSAKIWLPEKAENLPALPPYDNLVTRNLTIKRGKSEQLTLVIAESELEELNFQFGFSEGNASNASPFLFLGFIDYTDMDGAPRQTAFLREFNFATKRFDPINHPEYEYQD